MTIKSIDNKIIADTYAYLSINQGLKRFTVYFNQTLFRISKADLKSFDSKHFRINFII